MHVLGTKNYLKIVWSFLNSVLIKMFKEKNFLRIKTLHCGNFCGLLDFFVKLIIQKKKKNRGKLIKKQNKLRKILKESWSSTNFSFSQTKSKFALLLLILVMMFQSTNSTFFKCQFGLRDRSMSHHLHMHSCGNFFRWSCRIWNKMDKNSAKCCRFFG